MHTKQNNLQLHKFGGSSLANVRCYLRVVSIMEKYSMPGDIIVVSAAGSTTNQLINWLKLKQINQISAYRIQESLYRYQRNLISSLMPKKLSDDLIRDFVRDIKKLKKMLDGDITDAVYSEVVGYGEIWSARLMAAVLEQRGVKAVWLDARDFLRAERTVQPQVNEKLSYPLLRQLLMRFTDKRIVITGFISRNNAGETVLLGRNGSDYSATQIGALAGVSCVTIWSDVAGVYSADPHKVKNACLLPLLRLDEASELARLSAPVLHTRTLQPISKREIDLQLRCSLAPNQGSTRIERVSDSNTGASIVISHDDICLIEFQAIGEQNFKLTQKNIHTLLKRKQICPLAVGIHYDRQLLQFCYTDEMVNNVLKVLEGSNFSGQFRLRQGLALVAIVGAGVTRNPVYCYHFLKQLKDQPVEFTWKSEEAISLVAVLRKGPTKNLIQQLHTALFHAEKRISLLLFGKAISIFFGWIYLFVSEQF